MRIKLEMGSMPSTTRGRIGLGFLACVVVFGGVGCGVQIGQWARGMWSDRGFHIFSPRPQRRGNRGIPLSKMPGPPRTEKLEFRLDDKNAKLMNGFEDPENERWCDVLGSYYNAEFIRKFSYADQTATGPKVWVQVKPKGVTLEGRLEAKGLKPNFAYQIKLSGDFQRDRAGFEAIGKQGRWRLPGTGTNYEDEDYEDYPEEKKHEVEAYIFFDYFITDAKGNAVRNFYLDSSLHVLWKRSQYRTGIADDDMLELVVDASAPAFYARPKEDLTKLWIWAERETERYQAGAQVIRLPAQAYKASLALTEESFHSYDYDGGWWATIASVPIGFEVTQ